jgi:signal transduction histidine kinase
MEHLTIASRIATGSEEIAQRWLDRLAARVAVDREFVFPSEDLLDGIPLLIDAVSQHMSSEETPISANAAAELKARELGGLRYRQGFSARQILWEYELLTSVMLFYLEEAGESHVPSIRRLIECIGFLERATMAEFVEQAEIRLRDHEERLRAFQHALSHELRTEVGVLLGGARMLREDFVIENPDQRERFISIVVTNSERLRVLLDNLLELARLDLDTRQNSQVLLEHATHEAARRLRGFAQTKGVQIEIAPDFPALEVNAAAVDFCLTNLIANAIKYSDPAKPERWVKVRALTTAGEHGRVAIVEVADNGRGVPVEDRDKLFKRFFRASNAENEQGTGLGLSLVHDFVVRTGGRIWPEFPPGETVFVLTLPARRTDDA